VSSYSGVNPINNFEGVHTDFTYWIDSMRFETETSFVNYTSRLRALVSQVSIMQRTAEAPYTKCYRAFPSRMIMDECLICFL